MSISQTLSAKQRTYTSRDIFPLFLERKFIKLPTQCKLPIHTLLRDVEVFDIEEALVTQSRDQNLCLLLLSLLCAEATEIDGDQVCPVKVFLPLELIQRR